MEVTIETWVGFDIDAWSLEESDNKESVKEGGSGADALLISSNPNVNP